MPLVSTGRESNDGGNRDEAEELLMNNGNSSNKNT